jgi:putative nucleotidyltransferase with HDIG domain
MLAYVAVLVFATIGTIIWLVGSWSLDAPLAMVISLVVLAIVAERGAISINRTTQVSISLLPTLFAAVVSGPIAAMIVGAASMLGEVRPPMRWAVYTCSRGISAALTGVVAVWASGIATSTVGSVSIATVFGAVTLQSLDLSFAAATAWVRRSGSPRDFFRTALPVFPSSVILSIAVVAPLALAYIDLSPWTALLFLFPALAAQRLFAMYQEQRRLASDLAVVNEQLERANLSFASALVTTLDARDRYTAGHSAAVAIYARDIAGRLGFSTDMQQLAHLAGLLHDIGKIGVPPGILEKNGPLTLQERRKMEEHSVIGERILANVEAYEEIARIVRHHHERMDGQGYPDGISGDHIPAISRIICVADAYNAMTSDRPYRDAMTPSTARERLVQAGGTQFDQDVVDAFEAILETASETYSLGDRADFALEAQAHPEFTHATQASAA